MRRPGPRGDEPCTPAVRSLPAGARGLDRHRRRFSTVQTLAVRAEPDDGRAPVTLRYRLLAGGQIELVGTLDGRAVQAMLRKLDTGSMVLVSRRFHWISETYYNR